MPGPDHPVNREPGDGLSDEETRIRADERDKVEREMRSMGDEGSADDRHDNLAGGVHDRDADGVDDRVEGGGGHRAGGDHDRDRDGVDDRVEGDRGDGGDRGEGQHRGPVVAGAAATGAGTAAAHDRDRDGVDDRTERTAPRHDRDRDGVDDRVEGGAVGAGAMHDRDRDGVDDREREGGVFVREDETIQVERTRAFSFGQLLTMLAGAALIVLGVFALIDTGIDTPLADQRGEVLGWSHSALLGIVEIAAGALLVLFSLRPGGRWIVAVVGLALIVAGVLILGELEWAVDNLRSEQSFAWVPIVAGAVALLASLLTPRRRQRMTGVPVVR